jgi:hypothetical protein
MNVGPDPLLSREPPARLKKVRLPAGYNFIPLEMTMAKTVDPGGPSNAATTAQDTLAALSPDLAGDPIVVQDASLLQEPQSAVRIWMALDPASTPVTRVSVCASVSFLPLPFFDILEDTPGGSVQSRKRDASLLQEPRSEPTSQHSAVLVTAKPMATTSDGEEVSMRIWMALDPASTPVTRTSVCASVSFLPLPFFDILEDTPGGSVQGRKRACLTSEFQVCGFHIQE